MENKGMTTLMRRYEVGKLLGQGTFARVYHGKDVSTGTSVAIKIIDKEKILRVGMADQIKREISVMRLVRHPNIVQLYEVMASKKKIYFVMEYVRGGELFKKVADLAAKGKKLKEDVARKYFQQLICAVDFCHSRGVYHRDLKPENLLLDENGNVKVSDFGLSALTGSKRQDGLLHTTCGTPSYVAPEVINRQGYDGAKADIWSCGVILYVLLSANLPFQESNLMVMYRKISKAEFKYPNWFSPEVRRLISKMLDPNPNTRISIPKIMENYWFRKGLELSTGREDSCGMMTTTKLDPKENTINSDAAFKPGGTNFSNEQDHPHPMSQLNAFDIISFAAGFDLSGLFVVSDDPKKDMRFTSRQNAKTIISKLEELAGRLGLKVSKKDRGLMKLEGTKAGRKGVLSIDTEIFEITSDFHLVEVRKCSGDTLEYDRMVKQEIRPALKDIVWAWQGNMPEQPTCQLPEMMPLEQHELSQVPAVLEVAGTAELP